MDPPLQIVVSGHMGIGQFIHKVVETLGKFPLFYMLYINIFELILVFNKQDVFNLTNYHWKENGTVLFYSYLEIYGNVHEVISQPLKFRLNVYVNFFG